MMLTSLNLQKQLSSIMDILAKTAVAEISKIIENGSAVLYLAMSKSQEENQVLRRKLQLIESELRTVRASGQGEENNVKNQSVAIQSIPYNDCMSEIFIKEEGVKEDLTGDSLHRRNTGCENVVRSSTQPDAMEMVPVIEQHCLEEQKVQLASGERMGQRGAMCSVVERKPEKELVSLALGQTGSKLRTGRLNMNDDTSPDCQTCERPSDEEADHAGCSHSAEQYSVVEIGDWSLLLGEQRPGCPGGPASQWETTVGSNPYPPEGRRGAVAAGRPNACVYCGKCFRFLSYLKRHLRIHTGEKPYSCVQCGKRFSDRSSRKKHENTHTGKKPFRCLQCGKQFSRRFHLKRHHKLHMGEEAINLL